MQLFRVSPLLNEGAQRKCTGWIEHKPLYLHLGEAEKSNTNRFSIRRERATKQKEPLNMEMAPVN